MPTRNPEREKYIVDKCGPNPDLGWVPEQYEWDRRAKEAGDEFDNLPAPPEDPHLQPFERLRTDQGYTNVYYPIVGNDIYWGDQNGVIYSTARDKQPGKLGRDKYGHITKGLTLFGKPGPKKVAHVITQSVYGDKPKGSYTVHFRNNLRDDVQPTNMYWWLRASTILEYEEFREINNHLVYYGLFQHYLEENPHHIPYMQTIIDTFQRVYDADADTDIDKITKTFLHKFPRVVTPLYDRIEGSVIYTPPPPDADTSPKSESIDDDPRVLKVEFMDGHTEIFTDVKHAYDITEDYNS